MKNELNEPFQTLQDQIWMLSFHILQHLLLSGQQTLLLCQFVSHKILLSVYSVLRDKTFVNDNQSFGGPSTKNIDCFVYSQFKKGCLPCNH